MNVYIQLILITLLVSTIGTLLGLHVRKYNQKNLCPHCACREECNIGYTVQEAEDITGCCLCMNQKENK